MRCTRLLLVLVASPLGGQPPKPGSVSVAPAGLFVEPATIKPDTLTKVDSLWTGMNGNTGFVTDPAYVKEVSAKLDAIGARLVRTGMDNVAGRSVGAPFSWAARDAVVNAHVAAGDLMHMVVDPTTYADRGTSQAEWERNWGYHVTGVMRHYQGKVSYYIIDNEPDCCNTNATPAQMVAFTRIAFDSARAVDPDIRIESPPTTSPASPYLKQMIDLGVTRYAHVLGVHSYGDQISDGHRQSIRVPWQWMAASGHPVRPVASSENGVDANWGGRDWQSRWARQNYVQHKAWGYEHVLLYSFRSFAGTHWDFASWDGTKLVPWPAFAAVRDAYQRRPFANGGFEEPNNHETEWAIYWETAQKTTPAEWSRAEFVRNDAANAHSGSGYLRFTGSGTNRVRRVVEYLTPGKSYTLTGWVRIGSGTATLRAMGYNHLNGAQQQIASTVTRTGWQPLAVSFTPSRTWAVVSLEGTGSATAGDAMYWDDVDLR